jgi:predicted oxidoreductase
VPRFHVVWGSGQELASQLIRRLEAHPRRHKLHLKFGHKVDALTTSGGAVCGCSGVIEASQAAFEAKSGCLLVAAVVARRDRLDTESILAFVATSDARYKRLRKIYVVEAIPRTGAGKAQIHLVMEQCLKMEAEALASA